MHIVQLMDSLGLNRGGLTKAVFKRLRMYDANQFTTTIVVTGIQFNAAAVFAQLQEQGFIPQRTSLLCLFDDGSAVTPPKKIHKSYQLGVLEIMRSMNKRRLGK